MCLTSGSGVCVAFYKSHGGPTSPTKRSAVVLTSRHSPILSAPVVSSFLATLPVLIHPWITVEPLGPAWSLFQETGIVLPADLVIHGSGRWSLTLPRSTLVWQPPIDEPRTVKHGVLSWEQLRSTPDKPHDDEEEDLARPVAVAKSSILDKVPAQGSMLVFEVTRIS